MVKALGLAQGIFSRDISAEALGYLVGRGFSETVVREWGLGWAVGRETVRAALDAAEIPRGIQSDAGLLNDQGRDFFWQRITIPLRTSDGQVVGFAARTMDPEVKPKYVNTRETTLFSKRSLLFGLDRARAAAGRCKSLLLCEGQLDVIAAHQMGHGQAVATCGTALTAEHLESIKATIPGGTLVLAFDSDEAGQQATVAAVAACWGAGITVRVQPLVGGKDFAAALQAGETVALSPVGSGQWLVQHLCRDLPLAVPDRLVVADVGIELLMRHPDRDWQELHAGMLGESIGLGETRAIKRLRDRRRAISAPGSASGVVREPSAEVERDRGLHRSVVQKMTGFLADRGVAPDAVAGWLQDGRQVAVTSTDLGIDFWFEHVAQFEALSRERVMLTMEAMVRKRRVARRQEVLSAVTAEENHPEAHGEVVRWVRAVTGRADPVDVAVMLHFLWQVKRRVMGLEVHHDLMPILVGRQGDGKTWAVKRLIAPLQELVLGVSATTLTDDRCRRVLSQYVVGTWDEMQGGNKADVAALKHIITADTVFYRQLGGHDFVVLPKSISFIATSNDPVADIIPDTGGARRYYEMLSRSPKCDWDELNSIPYLLLWQAVSHRDPAPIEPHLDEVRRRQQGLVHKDPVTLWLQGEEFEELELLESDRRVMTDSGPLMASVVIPRYLAGVGEIVDHTYRRFARWCRVSGQSPVPPNKFGGRLLALGFRRQRDGKSSPGLIRPWRYHLPEVIPDDWAVADRLAPPPLKTPDQRAATQAAAAAAFGADWDDPPTPAPAS